MHADGCIWMDSKTVCRRPIRLCSVSCSARSDSSAISSASAHLASDISQDEFASPSNKLQSSRLGAQRLLSRRKKDGQPRMLSCNCPADASFTMEGGAASSGTFCMRRRNSIYASSCHLRYHVPSYCSIASSNAAGSLSEIAMARDRCRTKPCKQ